MRIAFVLCLFGQRFAFESKPETEADEASLSAVSETERDPVGFCATPEYYEEEERRR